MNVIQIKNRLIIALQSLFFATTLSFTCSIFASEKAPLTYAERTDLIYDDAFKKYPSIKILEEQPKGMRLGCCHNYVISKILGLKGKIPETLPIVGQEDWHTTIKFTEKYCKEVSTPQKGDLVTYHGDHWLLPNCLLPKSLFPQEVLHTALVYDDGIVEDKWGANTYVFTHPTFHVPSTYGNHVKYHRITKSTDYIIKDIKKTIEEYDYDSVCTRLNKELVNYAEQSDNNTMWQEWQRIMCTNVEASNSEDQSLVMIGAKTNNHTLVQLAIQHKANLNKKDKNGKTALYLAKENNHASIVALLKQQKSHHEKPFLYNTLKHITKPSKTAEESFWQISHS